MVNEGLGNTVLQEVSEWRRQGEELRARLMEERNALSARLKEIDEALAGIPDSTQFIKPPQVEPIPVAESSSAPDIVLSVISSHPKGIGAAEIIREAQSIRPTLDAALIHSAIYRLVKRGEVLSLGKRGTKVYRLNA